MRYIKKVKTWVEFILLSLYVKMVGHRSVDCTLKSGYPYIYKYSEILNSNKLVK